MSCLIPCCRLLGLPASSVTPLGSSSVTNTIFRRSHVVCRIRIWHMWIYRVRVPSQLDPLVLREQRRSWSCEDTSMPITRTTTSIVLHWYMASSLNITLRIDSIWAKASYKESAATGVVVDTTYSLDPILGAMDHTSRRTWWAWRGTAFPMEGTAVLRMWYDGVATTWRSTRTKTVGIKFVCRRLLILTSRIMII